MNKNQSIVVIGGGGHAKVLISTLLLSSQKVIGFTEKKGNKVLHLMGIPCLGNDEVVCQYHPKKILLVNGLGSVGDVDQRYRIYKKFKELGYFFNNVIHSSSILAPSVSMQEGVQIMAGAIIQVDSQIGVNTVINTRASVDHDCVIGNHVHIGPGVTLSGSVQVGHYTHIGTGATVIQGVKIGEKCVVGAGAVVIKDIPDGAKVVGIPARPL